MARYPLIAPVLLAVVSAAHGGVLTFNTTSDMEQTNIKWLNGATTETAWVYADQFQMSYQATPGGKKSTLYSFCVDLNDIEKHTPYNVQSASLTGLFGAINGNEMGYLYKKYGETNLHGNPVVDSALQLALWDLSSNPTVHHPTSFTRIGTTNYWGDSYFSANPATDRNAILAQTDAFLKEANSAVTGGYHAGGSVIVLQNVAGSTNPQQWVLMPTPEPMSLVLLGIGVAGVAAYRRRR